MLSTVQVGLSDCSELNQDSKSRPDLCFHDNEILDGWKHDRSQCRGARDTSVMLNAFRSPGGTVCLQ